MAYVRSNKASWEASKNNFAGGLAGLVDIGSRIYEAEKSALDAKDDLAARNYVTKMSGDYDIVMTKSLESEDPTKWLYSAGQYWSDVESRIGADENLSEGAKKKLKELLPALKEDSFQKTKKASWQKIAENNKAQTNQQIESMFQAEDTKIWEMSLGLFGKSATPEDVVEFGTFVSGNPVGDSSSEESPVTMYDRQRYESAESTFDKKMIMAEIMLKKIYPNNQSAVDSALAEKEQKARASQLDLDMKMLYSQQVGSGEIGYAEFLESYDSVLQSTEYGGKVLTDVERTDAMAAAQQYVQQQFSLERSREQMAYQTEFIPEYLEMVKSGKPIYPETLDEMFSRKMLDASLLFDEYTTLRVTAQSNDETRRRNELASLLAKRDQLIAGGGEASEEKTAEYSEVTSKISELQAGLPENVVKDVTERHDRVVENAYSKFADERVPTVYSMLMHSFFTNKSKSNDECSVQLDLYTSQGLLTENDYKSFRKMLEDGGRDLYQDDAYVRNRDALFEDVKKSLGGSNTTLETFRPMILESFHSAVASANRNGFVDYTSVVNAVKQDWVDKVYSKKFDDINDFLYNDYFGEVSSNGIFGTKVNDFGQFLRDYQSGVWDGLRVQTRFAAVMGEQTADNPFGHNLYNILKNSTYTDEQSARLILLSFAKDAGLAIPSDINIDAKGFLGTGAWDSFDREMGKLLDKAPVPLKNYILYNTAVATSALEVQKAYDSTLKEALGVTSTGLKRMNFDGNTIGVVGDDGLIYDMRLGKDSTEAQWFVRKEGQSPSEAKELTGIGYIKDNTPQDIAKNLETGLNQRLSNYNFNGLSETEYNALMANIYKDYTSAGEGKALVIAFNDYDTSYNAVMNGRAELLGEQFIPVKTTYKPTFTNFTNSNRKFTVKIQ